MLQWGTGQLCVRHGDTSCGVLKIKCLLPWGHNLCHQYWSVGCDVYWILWGSLSSEVVNTNCQCLVMLQFLYLWGEDSAHCSGVVGYWPKFARLKDKSSTGGDMVESRGSAEWGMGCLSNHSHSHNSSSFCASFVSNMHHSEWSQSWSEEYFFW